MHITIKGDSEGFMKLHCRQCGNDFKLHINEVKTFDGNKICCPYCGIKSSFQDMLPDEVIEEAKHMAMIDGVHQIQNMLSKSLKSTKNVSIKKSKLPNRIESTTFETNDTMDETKVCPVCGRSIKVIGSSANSKVYCSYCEELIWVID